MRTLIVQIHTDLDSIDIMQLMLAQHELETITTGYKSRNLSAPDWVTEKLDEVRRTVNLRLEAEMKRELAATQARLEALKTKREQREGLQARADELKEKLGNL